LEPDVNKVLLPPDVCILRRDTNKLSNSVGAELKGMLNNAKQKDYYDTVKNAFSEYQKRLHEYIEKIQSSIQIIAHFKYNRNNLAGDNYTAHNMYIQLFSAMYDRIRKDANEYYSFLQEIRDPIAYFEKQRQLKQTKTIEKSTENTLDNGNYLPPVKFQEYNDNVPRRRTKRGYEEII
jgi:hypothetical protein